MTWIFLLNSILKAQRLQDLHLAGAVSWQHSPLLHGVWGHGGAESPPKTLSCKKQGFKCKTNAGEALLQRGPAEAGAWRFPAAMAGGCVPGELHLWANFV